MSNDNDDGTTRRRVLKAGGSMGAFALVGGAGVLAASGSAAAAEMNLNANPVSAKNPDGDVDEVFIEPRGDIYWEDFDESVAHIHVKVESRVKDEERNAISGWLTAYDHTFGLGGHGGLSGEFNGQEVDEITLYGDDAGSTKYFDADDDGDTLRRVVDLRVTVELLDADRNRADPRDEALIRETASFHADSTNEAATSGLTADTNGGMN